MSGHNPGNATVQARTGCSGGQPYEYVKTVLFRQDCFFGVWPCWWTQVNWNQASSGGWPNPVTTNATYGCNGSSNHTYQASTYHEVRGWNGATYTGTSGNQNPSQLPCG
jgi:hypothetical protein